LHYIFTSLIYLLHKYQQLYGQKRTRFVIEADYISVSVYMIYMMYILNYQCQTAVWNTTERKKYDRRKHLYIW